MKKWDLVISQTKRAPAADLQYDLVIDLKDSCPAYPSRNETHNSGKRERSTTHSVPNLRQNSFAIDDESSPTEANSNRDVVLLLESPMNELDEETGLSDIYTHTQSEQNESEFSTTQRMSIT
eukprot:TRINITY_DN8753_c0_g2_i2.p1 TRINITY_DN8753_c0_g2~~TRINITY_DN8753_c0_g2_i2.p1  ORF type:complete len:122 (-),score=10.71 TRINITY_DN8753_c0_g2_i2:98-463(-)